MSQSPIPVESEIKWLSIKDLKPNPKCGASIENDVLPDQGREGGVNPTAALQKNEH